MNPEDRFWEWFKLNNVKYLYLESVHEDEIEKRLDLLLEQLHLYCDEIFFSIADNENRGELIITAEGNVVNFPKVEKLVGEAPSLSNWDIIAFKNLLMKI